jgi:NADH dehydrogenase
MMAGERAILVTGAGGLVGRGLCEILAAGRRPVRALVHNPALVAEIESFGVEAVAGDVLEPDRLASALGGVTSVIHLAEPPRETDPLARFPRALEGLLAAVSARPDFDLFVYVSAAGAREDARTPFLRAKWRNEKMLEASGRDRVIFRPSAIYAPDDAFVNSLALKMQQWRALPAFGAGRVRIQPLSRSELVAALASALDHPFARNRTFDVGGPEILSLKDIMSLLRERLNLKTRYLPLPLSTALKVASQDAREIAAGFSRTYLDVLRDLKIVDNSEFLAVFPFSLQPLKEGLRGYALPDASAHSM